MFKLNKKGWEMKDMLIISAILFIFLLIASYYIYVLYNNLMSNDASKYYTLEVKIKNAAAKYVVDYNIDLDSKIEIRLSDLKRKGYIYNFLDENGNACDGIVIIDNGEYNPYISCDNYTTDGYQNFVQ